MFVMLFVMTACVVRAHYLAERGTDERGATALADLYCRQARRRIGDRFDVLFNNDDRAAYGIAERLLDGEFEWLEAGIVSLETYRQQLEASVAAQTQTDKTKDQEPAHAK